ncbi:MAG TPA: tetraacyldisaccharide 4'-kinase [Polyangiaceae bacterium]|nr:tetraacyldisaccharide 4'-kinase [Polyangiaceae bacterium]
MSLLGRFVSRHLEKPTHLPRWARLVASPWSVVSARSVCRPLSLPRGKHVIGIGGATLGGSYKTPLAIRLCEALSKRGVRVALVGHAYGGQVAEARPVDRCDMVQEVGDDALYAARELAAVGVEVVVGPSRQAAIDRAARLAEVLVVDGLLQSRPQRIARSLLVLDSADPWGSGHCPPIGDLRAPPRALLGAADAIAWVGERGASRPDDFEWLRARHEVGIEIAGTSSSDSESLLAPQALAKMRLGLVLAIARPHRVLVALGRLGVVPETTVLFADHEVPSVREITRAMHHGERPAAWLTTKKCATKLPTFIDAAPVLTIQQNMELAVEIVDWSLPR